MSLYSYPVMCPHTKGKIVSGDIFVGINEDTGEFVLAIECMTCRERHHFPFAKLSAEVRRITKEENRKIAS